MISLYFGLPRCGKTTTAVAHTFRAASKKRHVYTNIPFVYERLPSKLRPYIHVVPNSYFGRYDMSNGLLIIDEASIYADSRQFAKFPTELVEFFCLHGHYRIDIELYCQIYSRVDSTIRMLAERVYWIKKPLFTGFLRSKIYRVPYGIAFTPPPEGTHSKYGDIVEGYCEPSIWGRMFAQQIWRMKYYKYFDSYQAPPLPPMPEQKKEGD